MCVADRDEFEHQPSEERLWRESFHLNFHDRGGRVAGMVSVGVRPNQNLFEGFAVIFLDGRVLFHRTGGGLDTAEAGLFVVPGIQYEILTPLESFCYAANAAFVEVDPAQIVRGAALPEATLPAGFDLAFGALAAPYRFPRSDDSLAGPAEHFEQDRSVRGGGRRQRANPFSVVGRRDTGSKNRLSGSRRVPEDGGKL